MQEDSMRTLHEQQLQLTFFADAKAGALIVLFSGVLGGLAPTRSALLDPMRANSWESLVAIVAGVLLVAAIACLAVAITPRGGSASKHRNLVYWKHIASFKDGSTFVDDMEKLSATSLTREWALNAHALARIVNTKFLWIRIAFWIGILGTVLGATTLVALHEPKGTEVAVSVAFSSRT